MSPYLPSNLLLEALPDEVRRSVLAQCSYVDLPLRTPLFNELERPRYVHFMTSGMASTVTLTEAGGCIEVGITGHEGFPEKYHLLGPQDGNIRCFMQIPGSAYRMSFKGFQELFLTGKPLMRVVHRYIQHEALVLGQLGACNRLHGAQGRLARWLLMVFDRTRTSEVRLTQEFMGEMLGTTRSSVNIAAGGLQQAGYIAYSRGKVALLDRAALEHVACECYPEISKLFRGLYK